MRWLLAFLLAACSCDPIQWRTEPEAAGSCEVYCKKVAECTPALAYPDCARDCETLVADPMQSKVSGIDADYLTCWAQAQTCTQARACSE